MEDGVFSPTSMGTPQGGVISPLLANIALNSLDWHLHELGLRFVRYADDFVVLCETEAQVKEAHDRVQQHLTQLGLALSPEKTKMTGCGKFFWRSELPRISIQKGSLSPPRPQAAKPPHSSA